MVNAERRTGPRPPSPWRRIWNWHLWLGLGVILPLVFWMGTALVFALWPIQTVRGVPSSTGRSAPVHLLQAGMLPPGEQITGAKAVTLRHVEGHPVALLERGPAAEVWDLEAQRSLGASLPLAWAEASARRDFSRAWDLEAVYLYPRTGPGSLQAGQGPEHLPPPDEYTGPRPVYAFHLRPGRTHLYVDGLTGDVRARRTRVWRFYDLAFRLHSFEFTGDGLKRIAMLVAVGLWLAVGGTGLVMALRKLRRRA